MKLARAHRRWNTRDRIEAAIVKALADLYVEWVECPPLDGWITLNSVPHPVEIKDEERNARKGGYTANQLAFIAYCKRNNVRYLVWTSPEDAVRDVLAIRRERR